MARVAIYARYSSDLQNPRSIEDQVALCRRWCEREGHGVFATFSDAALSGASIHGRAGLKSMIAGAVEREFEIVIVESFDRVARSQSELPQVWEMLRFCGCELIAVDDGRASEISIGVRGLVGALYLTDLASKTRRGLAGKLAQGQRAGGLPYGYRPIVGGPGEHEIAAVVWPSSVIMPRAAPVARSRPHLTMRELSRSAAAPGTPRPFTDLRSEPPE
jgi:site-specific DNA recombinase